MISSVERRGNAGEAIQRSERDAVRLQSDSAIRKTVGCLSLDMMSYSFHDNFALREWSEKDRQVLFTPDFMRRVWFLAPLKFLEEVRSPEEFYLRPLLDREKFPQDRRIEIPADLEERIRAREAAGHVVFMSAVRARAQ